MSLTHQQLEAIVARAFPGERLVESRAVGAGRYALARPGGERLAILLYETEQAADAAAAALRRLRGEIDLPIPQLRASDPAGETIGRPYLLLSEIAGDPIEQALPQLGEQQLYELGRRLGAAVCRVHRLACDRYGALAGDDPDASADERAYALARLERDLARCTQRGIVDRHNADEVRGWFEREFKPAGRSAALVCGGLRPDTILVRRSEGRWWISALLGWEHALGWSPAWDHTTFLDATAGPRWFGLRVGYGNSYDETTTRAYEQVREHALRPYRALLALRYLCDSHDSAERSRLRELLKGLMRAAEREAPASEK
jgi:aminoglycoside phosphotransferase (APT) family kinase protein